MKGIKRIISLLLVMVLFAGNVLPIGAQVDSQAVGMAGRTVTIRFSYPDVMGVQGTFTFSDRSLFSAIEVTAPKGTLVESVDKTGKVVCGGSDIGLIVLDLKLTFAEDAQVGKQCDIVFTYETYYSKNEYHPIATDKVTVTVLKTVYYDALIRLIEQAEALNKNEYTADSWLVLQEALEEARQALYALTQEEVDAAYAQLQAAMDALVTKIDYSELRALINTAKSLTETDYTAVSWAVLRQALAVAEEALTSVSQREVDLAAQQLAQALDQLERIALPDIDYSELKKQIKIATALNRQDYTEKSWKVLDKALTAALAALDSTEQAVVDKAASDLKQAIAQLVLIGKVNYDELNRQIAIAESLNKLYYTEDSWFKMTNALDAARAARKSNDQAVVDQAASNLKSAIAALKRVQSSIDYTALDEQIRIAENLKRSQYTRYSWDNMMNYLEAARNAMSSKEQSEVDKAASDLKQAIAALVPMNYQKLLEAIAAVRDHIQNDELAQLWGEMYQLLSRAEDLLESGDQQAVDACVIELNELLAKIIAKLADLQHIIVAEKEKNTINGEYCNITFHRVWPILFWVSLALNLILAGLIAGYLVMKKKRTSDDTPLVDYDIDDDAE